MKPKPSTTYEMDPQTNDAMLPFFRYAQNTT